ncbi:hypothetical protein FSARC_9646 [Fusarium sarcochroum]|uniref:Xylanolytic transcriptional activator regulatory domain-containing protein n=1 Tax=Fusarium sarcochroum TaxID=1208366 RepID=A0A8H4TQP8_9HYPO|nr:hypothetical protein FSARC_9646 [Fusarium sarcochroum]
MVSDERALGHEARHSQAVAIEACIRPYGPHLVDLFWRHIQPCYPLLHRDFFMQNYNKSSRRISPALLGAVYLSALKWWSYNPELSVRDPPDSTLLRRLVKSAIDSSYHQPRLSSIQAILLLLQCQPEDALNPDHTYAWGLTCQALAIGQCLGLHLDASQWSIPTWEKNVRRRLSWALYMQDRWTALAYGRPVHIHHDDWSVQELTFVDFVDCESSGSDEERRTLGATGNLQFMHMVRLSLILYSILSSFYTARTSSEQDTTWYSEIPASLQMNITYQRKLCFHGYLHFSYYGVMMTLLRRLIRSTALPPRCPDDQILAEIRQLALQTSQGAINFVMNLRPDQLESFWYFISKSSEPMRYAVNRLEGAILRGLEHALAVNLNDSGDDEVSPMMANGPTEAFEYTDFGHWDLAAGVNGSFDFLTAFDLDSQYLDEL